MSGVVTKVPATVKSATREYWERDVELANAEAYAASSIAASKTVHGAYDGSTTVFELDEPLADGRTSYATPDRRVFALCGEAGGEKCVLGFNDRNELKLVELGDVSVSLSRRVGLGWTLGLMAVAFVIVGAMLMLLLGS